MKHLQGAVNWLHLQYQTELDTFVAFIHIQGRIWEYGGGHKSVREARVFYTTPSRSERELRRL